MEPWGEAVADSQQGGQHNTREAGAQLELPSAAWRLQHEPRNARGAAAAAHSHRAAARQHDAAIQQQRRSDTHRAGRLQAHYGLVHAADCACAVWYSAHGGSPGAPSAARCNGEDQAHRGERAATTTQLRRALLRHDGPTERAAIAPAGYQRVGLMQLACCSACVTSHVTLWLYRCGAGEVLEALSMWPLGCPAMIWWADDSLVVSCWRLRAMHSDVLSDASMVGVVQDHVSWHVGLVCYLLVLASYLLVLYPRVTLCMVTVVKWFGLTACIQLPQVVLPLLWLF